MEFFIESHSPLAPYLQIQEQVKLALLLGRLRPGDTLPSIRDVQEQAQVSQNVVRRAYLGLEKSGVLTLRHGKGVLVATSLDYKHDSQLLAQCEGLAGRTISKIRHLGISTTAFARYLYQKGIEVERFAPISAYVDATKPLADERAAKISSVWQAKIPGLSFAEIAESRKNGYSLPRSVLTNYYRLDQVRKLMGKQRIEVIPLGLTFSPVMLAEFSRLSTKASVVLVLEDEDYPSLSLILAGYRKVLVKDTVKLTAVPFSQVRNWHKFLAHRPFDKVVISNRIWDQVPAALKRDKRLTRPLMDVDLASLESVRIKSGIIV